MSIYTEKAQALRDDTTTHYNCAQAVLMAFAEKAGIGETLASKVALNFGAGMKNGGMCGAVTGSLMVLGLFGVTDAATYYTRVKEAIGAELTCAELVHINAQNGGEKKVFCDGLISKCVSVVETILSEEGKL